MSMGRPDTKGPVILWISYGSEGWQPNSFDTVKEALEAERYTTQFVITRVVDYEVKENLKGTVQ